MPIHEYRCDGCGRLNTFLVRSGSTLELRCEGCGGGELTRQISRPAIIRTRGGAQEVGSLRPADPRRTAQQMVEMYGNSGADLGSGFNEVAKRIEAGDGPGELKEAIKEARQKDQSAGPSQG